MKDLAGKAFVVGTWLVLTSVLVQFLLAGLGVFAFPGFLFWHTTVNAAVIGLVPLLLVAVGWFGRVPRRLLWLCASVSGLTALQSLLLFPYHLEAQGVLRAISGLHVPNAVFLFWVTLQLVGRTHSWSVGAAMTDGQSRRSRA